MDSIFSALSLISPGHRLELVKELRLHHGDLVDDEVSTARPVLQHPGPLSQLDTLLQWGWAGANAWRERAWIRKLERQLVRGDADTQLTPSTVQHIKI